MKKPDNLKLYKTELRNSMRQRRMALPPEQKAQMDAAIARQLFGMSMLRDAETVLIYVSKEYEVETKEIIQKLWAMGKRVAAPRCMAKREMSFFYITSFEELVQSDFGILEPLPDEQALAVINEHTFCVVPATCCDPQGYRLGYGGGFYDRFLSTFPGIKAVILYSDFIVDKLWHGRYDIPVDYIVTEKLVLSVPQIKRSPANGASFNH